MSLACPEHGALSPVDPAWLLRHPGAYTHRCEAPGCWSFGWLDGDRVTITTGPNAARVEIERRLRKEEAAASAAR